MKFEKTKLKKLYFENYHESINVEKFLKYSFSQRKKKIFKFFDDADDNDDIQTMVSCCLCSDLSGTHTHTLIQFVSSLSIPFIQFIFAFELMTFSHSIFPFFSIFELKKLTKKTFQDNGTIEILLTYHHFFRNSNIDCNIEKQIDRKQRKKN